MYSMWLPQAGMKDGLSGNYIYITDHAWPSMKEITWPIIVGL